MAITKYSDKGDDLTYAEMDANWDELINLLSAISVASGNVGIGTEMPTGLGKVFNVDGGLAGASLNLDGGGNFGVFYVGPTAGDPASLFSNNGFKFGVASDKSATGFSEKMRITADGKILINTTDNNGGALQIGGASYFPAKAIVLTGAESTRYQGIIGSLLVGGDAYGMTFGTRSNNVDYNNTLTLHNGEVLIATTVNNGSGAKLQVAGDIEMTAGGVLRFPGTSAGAGAVFSTTASAFIYVRIDGVSYKIPAFTA